MMSDGEPLDELRLVQVYSSQGHLQANVIKSKLGAAGIPALLSYESVGLVMGLTVDGIGKVRVMVPEGRLDEALDLIREDDVAQDDLNAPVDPIDNQV
jgi:hypothetical protein